MKSNLKSLIVSGLILMVLFGFSAGVFAAPAGTEIKNQATATYEDQNGIEHSASSNEVVTTVQQICGLTIKPDGTDSEPPNTTNTQYTAPGNTVYYSYTLTNTGNGADTYKFYLQNSTGDDFDPVSAAIYLDENGNGLVDSGEQKLWDSADDGYGTYGSVDPSVGADGTIKLVARYEVPSSGVTDGDVTRTNISGQSQACATNPEDSDNWNQTTITNSANITATKSATPGEVDPGGEITYQIEGSNTGEDPAYGRDWGTNIDGTQHEGILITDEIPADTTLVSGSWVNGTNAPASGFAVFSDDDGTTWSSTAPGDLTTVTHIAWFIPDADDGDGDTDDVVLSTGQAYAFEFKVTANSDTEEGIITNSAIAQWSDSSDATNPEEAKKSTTTNDADVLVNPVYQPFIGPQGDPEASGPNDQNDDTTDAGTQSAGTWVSFTNTVKNAANGSDTINITEADSPTGWQVQLYKSDGLTPLADTNGDGIPDVGELAAGETRDIVVKVFIPYDESLDDDGQTTQHDSIIRATSTGDSTKTNETIDRVTDIVPAGVDISNNPYNEGKVTEQADPGECARFPLQFINKSGTYDTFTGGLDQSLESGWSISFYPDADLDGTADSTTTITSALLGGALVSEEVGSTTTIPVTNVNNFESGSHIWIDLDQDGIVASDESEFFEVNSVGTDTLEIDTAVDPAEGIVVGEIGGVIAQVCVAEGETPGDYDFTIEVVSSNNATVTDTITDTVSVGTVGDVSLTPNRSGTGAPGGTVTYGHTLCNTGNVNDTFDLSYSSDWGWTYTFLYGEDYTDNNGTPNDTGDDTQYSAGDAVTDTDGDGSPDIPNLPASQCVDINVKGFVPSDPAINQVDSAIITATGDSTGATDTASDLTTVIAVVLDLTKEVAPEGDQPPGTTLTYTTTYKNNGNSTITDVVIYDAIPEYTTFAGNSSGVLSDGSTAIGGGNIYYSTDGGASWVAKSSFGGNNADVTNIKWEVGSVPAGADGYVEFDVEINED